MTLPTRARGTVGWVGLLAGPTAAIAAYVALSAWGSGLDARGMKAAAVAVLMATWWLTEAIPLAATALVPIALFPLLGISGVGEAARPYANELIFLFMGGFILGLGMERWGLHRRIALRTIGLVGTRPRRLIAGFMLSTALMSMWVSNTATVIMMMPIAASVIGLVSARAGETSEVRAFATALVLGVAYAASIGGVGTLIGTPPNIVLAGFVRERYGLDISMSQWMLVGVPIVVAFLPLAWWYLTRIAHRFELSVPGGAEAIAAERRALGAMGRGEWVVFAVFMVTAGLWISRPWLADAGTALLAGDSPSLAARVAGRALAGLSDAGIAVLAALALFVIPVEPTRRVFAMDWPTASRLPWGVLLLFGGGLSLASAMTETGVAGWLGDQLGVLRGVPTFVVIAVVALGVIFLTELTSNTAVATALMPVLASAAAGLGIDAIALLAPAAVAASLAFMLPVATPPNAIVFASGRVTVGEMARAGFWLNLAGAAVVAVLAGTVAPAVLR